METLRQLEETVLQHYDENLKPVADRLAADLPRSAREVPSLPMVLFLGNHSSGKSSFINHLLGSPRQKTGLAPTDDGFTVLVHGESPEEFDGQSAVTHPGFSLGRLEKLGPHFLGRMRLKSQPSEVLRSMCLVDSPGMIDAAGTASGRAYDFAAGVREFAEMSDLILFFFDPDKPGTTGETVSIFTETLAGLEHKLLIVLNKVDLFANIRDFARTYGTLCWNLSKTMQTKDVPHIFNTYLPREGSSAAAEEGTQVPLADFEISREEVETEIRRAPARRADNLVSDLLFQARALYMQGRIAVAVSNDDRSLKWRFALGVAGVLAGTAGATALAWNDPDWKVPALWGAGGVLVAVLVAAMGIFVRRRFRRKVATAAGLEPYFEAAHRQELTWADRADLRGLWEYARPRLLRSISLLGVSGLPHGFRFRRHLRRLLALIETQIPQLRRKLPESTDPDEAAAPPENAVSSGD